LTALFALGVWAQTRVRVDQVSGFREIATYLKANAPTDAVLYDGEHGGLFGFSVRVQDPQFTRRVALGEKLLYSYGPTTSFEWVQTSNVASTEDVVNLLRRSGCRWVALELGEDPRMPLGKQLLRRAVNRTEFTRVGSFLIVGAGDRHVELYRLSGDVNAEALVDLSFPRFSTTKYMHIVPITR
jgi:hypothetical protein